MRTMATAMLPLLLSACAGPSGENPSTAPVAEGSCRNEALDRFVGKTASAYVAAEMLKASGARAVRWGAPGMALTMDFRADRITVSYDGKMVISSARCG